MYQLLLSFQIFMKLLLYHITGNLTQGFNGFLTLMYVLWDLIRHEINVH